jgi:hypothetical protein
MPGFNFVDGGKHVPDYVAVRAASIQPDTSRFARAN